MNYSIGEMQFQKRLLISHLAKLIRMVAKDRDELIKGIKVRDEIKRVNARLQDIRIVLTRLENERD